MIHHLSLLNLQGCNYEVKSPASWDSSSFELVGGPPFVAGPFVGFVGFAVEPELPVELPAEGRAAVLVDAREETFDS